MSAYRRRWSISLRMLFMVVTAVAVIVVFGKWAFRPEVEQIPFDAAAWKLRSPIARHRTVRSQMVDVLLQEYNFQGWTRQEIVRLLGKPDTSSGFPQFDIVYVLGVERSGRFSLDNEALGFKLDQHGRVATYRLSVD